MHRNYILKEVISYTGRTFSKFVVDSFAVPHSAGFILSAAPTAMLVLQIMILHPSAVQTPRKRGFSSHAKPQIAPWDGKLRPRG